jgi:tRNA (guanine37-N1)-methyltransferase
MSLRIEVFTIFPDVVDGYCSASILGRARRDGPLQVKVHDLRQWADDPRRSVDDSPFGGGPGMVLAPQPIFAAVEAADPPRPLFLLSPAGRRLDQQLAAELAATSGFSLLCGRYEGVDQRVADHLADGEISIGDFVLAGGELAALVVIEAVARLVPGVVGNEASTTEESFGAGLLEYPQYTRPAMFRGWAVPEVLTSGDHGKVAAWRLSEALRRTAATRPDLLERRGPLDPSEVRLLVRHGYRVPPSAAGQSTAPPESPTTSGEHLPEEQLSS